MKLELDLDSNRDTLIFPGSCISIGLLDQGTLQSQTLVFNDWLRQPDRVRAAVRVHLYTNFCEALIGVYGIGEAPSNKRGFELKFCIQASA